MPFPDDVAELIQGIRVFGAALDLVAGYAAARPCGAGDSTNFCVGRQLAERSTFLLGQYVANVEHP